MRARFGTFAADLRHRLRRPLSFYLTALVIIAIVPSFVFSLVILKRITDEQDRVMTALLKGSTGAVTRVVEREIEGMLTALKALSPGNQIDPADLAALHARAVAALADTGNNLLLIDRTGQQLLNTRVAFGSPLGPASDPKSISQAFQSGEPLVSDVFFGRTAQRWVYNVYLPVRTPSGQPDYLLTLTGNADGMRKAVNRDVLSPGWNAALLDRTGKLIASSDPSLAVGKPFFMDLAPALNVGIHEASHDGVAYRTVTEFSMSTGWRIVAWAKSSAVDAPVFWSFLWLSAGAVLFAGFAVAGSTLIARVLAQGVKMVERDARLLGEGQPIAPREHMITEVETVSQAIADAAQARAKAENEIRFLMREVAHRSKNQLTVIQSMLNQSVTSPESRQDFADTFRKRIAGLARSTDLMIANASQGVDFGELARNQLQPFIPDDPARVRIFGPSVRLDAQVSQTLGMALHELATNATKYGALANGDGTIDLAWTSGDEDVVIVWRERGADLSDIPSSPRKGFGTMVLERMLAMALGATLKRSMHDDGIEWHITIPRARLLGELVEES
ncbi:sensor histidine kinase [Pararhizobium arenae]|uniref:sensor histidine kinase n=1 Tax=Pararhizobium arenae TaxID=1856850 RepID=UPI00094B33A3|nr:sensor histidine kinase [Pararhizobium arenae]